MFGTNLTTPIYSISSIYIFYFFYSTFFNSTTFNFIPLLYEPSCSHQKLSNLFFSQFLTCYLSLSVNQVPSPKFSLVSRKFSPTLKLVLILEKTLKYVIFRFIMNSNLSDVKVENLNDLEEQTKQTKTFLQDIFQIDYINSSKISYQLPTNSSDVRVNNYLCYQEGQILYKITEVIYQDKVIRIEDKFEISVNPVNMRTRPCLTEQKIDREDKKASRNIQKVRMFNKNQTKLTNSQKKDKKNIVKNVVKIFNTWLQKKSDKISESEIQIALKVLQELLLEENYNNRLIKKMAERPQINKCFLNFLEDSANDQIKHSRIQDKESHYQALQIYKNLLQNIQNQQGNEYQNHFLSSNEVESQVHEPIAAQKKQKTELNTIIKSDLNNKDKKEQNVQKLGSKSEVKKTKVIFLQGNGFDSADD